MKKQILLLTVILLITATTAQAEVKSSTLLKGLESARTSQNWGVTIGLFRGVIQTHLMYQAITPKMMTFKTSTGEETTWPRSCQPDNITIGQMTIEYVYWAKNSGQFKPDDAAPTSILVWLFKAYPCGDYY